MSIESFIKKVCVQTAVYWAPTGDDGFGHKTFSYPVEIKCRWENVSKIIMSNNGKEIVSVAEVLVYQDLMDEGWLYLGELADLDGLDSDSSADSDKIANPMLVDGAQEIKSFSKIPMIMSTSVFVRKAYL